MKHLPEEITMIDVDAIRPFISRARKKAGFEGLVESIRQHGLKVPVEVRDITDDPAAARKRPDGGHYKYELVKGEGRTLAHREIGLRKIPAYVIKAAQAEIVGRFLAENMARRPLLWSEKARLIKSQVEAGESVPEIARRYVITEGYAYKLLRVLAKTAQGLETEVAAMAMNDALALTELPADHQSIVVQALTENPQRQVRDIIRKAQEIEQEGKELSPMALKESLKRIDGDLARLRQSLKVTRLHHALGPQNIQSLLRRKEVRAALTPAGVNVQRFEEVCQ